MATYGRISLNLNEEEFTALIQMSELDCRQPREQLRFLLREEARQRGLLSSVLIEHLPEPRQAEEAKSQSLRNTNC